ncbi:CheR family methyltransferase [Desulfogranum mediterraneum]|uniref:CheR family methyltransferase n=1 Tax=Desulfogranum mediterraneum TaxID=160661 RepID=UPI0003F81A8C|nr:CheR family methyltransferase [Desulfogranum mediterraneum]
MRDEECVRFLQWALPQLELRWPGFRKVRAQVCKRLQRRLSSLALETVDDYQGFLTAHPEEWEVLDEMSRVTISRFYRDRMMCTFLEQEVLPSLAEQAMSRGDHCLKVWSVGCCCGEEPYTVAIIWKLGLQTRFPRLGLQIVATDANPDMVRRARRGCYPLGSVKNLPRKWRERAFTRQGDDYCLKAAYRADTVFMVQDVREAMPSERFDLVLCRNLVFTYYQEELQSELLGRLTGVVRTGGALVIGIHEQLPAELSGLRVWSEKVRIYRKTA